MGNAELENSLHGYFYQSDPIRPLSGPTRLKTMPLAAYSLKITGANGLDETLFKVAVARFHNSRPAAFAPFEVKSSLSTDGPLDGDFAALTEERAIFQSIAGQFMDRQGNAEGLLSGNASERS